MKLIRTATEPAAQPKNQASGSAIDRRTFLKRSGITLGGAAAATALAPTMMRKAHAASIPSGTAILRHPGRGRTLEGFSL